MHFFICVKCNKTTKAGKSVYKSFKVETDNFSILLKLQRAVIQKFIE